MKSKINFVLRGANGCGKTTIVKRSLKELENESNDFSHFSLEFSSKTTSKSAQKSIEMYLEKKHGDFFRPICDKFSAFCIDNINLGQEDSFEFLRQLLAYQGLYLKPSYQWVNVKKFSILGVSSQIQGSNLQLPPRLLRHVMMLEIAPFDSSSTYQIVHSILQLYFNGFDFKIDYQKAIQYYQKAASLNNSDAFFQIGTARHPFFDFIFIHCRILLIAHGMQFQLQDPRTNLYPSFMPLLPISYRTPNKMRNFMSDND